MIQKLYNLKKIQIDTFCICLLFFLCIVFPFQFYILKIGLIGLFLIQSLNIKKLRKGLYKERSTSGWWTGIFIFTNLFFICLGEFHGNEAFRYYITTEFFWFILYSFIFLYIDIKIFFTLLRFIALASYVVLSLGILAFVQFNLFGKYNFLNFQAAARPGYPFIAIAGGSVTPMIFFGPLFLLFGINKIKSKIFVIFLILFVIATSRRSFMLNIMLAPFFFILFYIFYVKEIKERKMIKNLIKNIFIVFFIIIISLLIYDYFTENFDLDLFIKFFKNAFKLSRSIEKNIDNSSFERAKQTVALINGWKEHIIFGSGIAANASVVRSTTPGMYEMTYLAIIFQRGIIGILLYLFQFLYLFSYLIYYGIKYRKIRNFCFSFCASLICFMIANGTNPYLEAFDYLWFIFLPFSIINLINRDPNQFIKVYLLYANRR